MYEIYGAPDGLGANEDVLVIASHNGTHMDALSHVFSDGKLYNGFPSSSFASHTGADRCGIEKSGGFATGAVVLDLAKHFGVPWLEPGHPITGDELEACRAAQGLAAASLSTPKPIPFRCISRLNGWQRDIKS